MKSINKSINILYKKKILIYGTSYHARLAFRKLSHLKFEILGFVQFNDKFKQKKFFDKKVYNYKNLKEINFNQVIFAGRYIKTQVKDFKKLYGKRLNKKIK